MLSNSSRLVALWRHAGIHLLGPSDIDSEGPERDVPIQITPGCRSLGKKRGQIESTLCIASRAKSGGRVVSKGNGAILDESTVEWPHYPCIMGGLDMLDPRGVVIHKWISG